MDLYKYREHPLFFPVGLALLLHLFLVSVSTVVRFPGLRDVADRVTSSFQLDKVNVEPSPAKARGTISVGEALKQLQFVGQKDEGPERSVEDVSLRELLEREEEITSPAAPAPEPVSLESSFEKATDYDALLEETQERLKDRVEEERQAVAKPKVPELPSILKPMAGDNLIETLRKPLQTIEYSAASNVRIDPAEGMPAFTPSVRPLADAGIAGIDVDRFIGEATGSIQNYEALDEFLDIDVYTYRDPKDGAGYYMIKIFAKRGARGFRAMPKEIVFAIDASLSISRVRLEEFKRGIAYALKHLNKEDVFNIVAFKDKAAFFRPESVLATKDTIKAAEQFVTKLTPSEQTDVYQAFNEIVGQKPGRTPSYILLISDGRPTYGTVDSREVINSVSRINQRSRPVFAYSGGGKVNRYLLDFIAYQNRGWSQFNREVHQIDTGLAQFYEKIKDPIFLNLRYRLSNVNETEVFPKFLPDFYRDAEFTLYGKYEGETDFSMQLLGDVRGTTKELIFTRSFKDAVKGGKEIMQGYAFNKVYHLINRVTAEGANDTLLGEIEALSRRYGIETPYSADILKSR